MRGLAMFLVLSMPGAVANAASPNLLENSGFEFFSVRGKTADGWGGSAPNGGTFDVDTAVFHSGAAALRFVVPDSVPVSWHTMQRGAGPLKRGATYTLSGWVRTENVRDGVGAYLSLSFFDGADKRLAFNDSPSKLTGTTDWTRITATGQIPDGASEMRVLPVLHGHGTVWFDDLQVEEGSAATDYQPAAADAERKVKDEADAGVAVEWLKGLPARPVGHARIAVLDMAVTPADFAPVAPDTASRACPSSVPALVTALSAAGHAAFAVSPEQLANTHFLDPAQIDVLVIPSGDLFPIPAHAALVEYLRSGGAFVSMGGYAFDRPVVGVDGKWSDPGALPIPDAPTTAVFGAGLEGWKPSTDRPEPPVLQAIEGPGGATGFELSTPNLIGWDTVISPPVAGTLPADWSVLRFWAKGDAQTPSMWIEWSETDGSRWHKAIRLGTEWTEYKVPAGELTYWQDNPSVGRGGTGDRFRPVQASRFQFGVAGDVAEKGRSHRVLISGLSVQADPLAALRVTAPHINTRWARIRDALWPEPEQIGVFDSAFTLDRVASTRAAAGQAVVAEFALNAPLAGYSATAMLGLNGHGFGPNRARWLPLLDCVDAFDRPRGHAGAMVHHFSGTYTGSSWAVFGVTNHDLFAAGSPALDKVLVPVVESLLRRLYVHESDTNYACYRPGESVTFRTRVSNYGREAQRAEVRFVVTADGAAVPAATLAKPIELNPGDTVTVENPWPLPEAPSDFYRVSTELWLNGARIDVEEGAFVVWSAAVIERGPRFAKDGTRFLVDGRPQFLMGCQTYWGQNGSVTARCPLGFDRDYRQMRDSGLRWTRCFVPFKTEEDKRISDAMVQLAQKYGIVFYHTPNLHNTAAPAELAEQAKTAREIAARYRDVPGMAVDICNEPAFTPDEASLVTAFGKPGKAKGDWQDADVTAFWWCMTNSQRAWASVNCAAFHADDPARLVSVGWSQGWVPMKDPIIASLDLDFTDRHYYGKPGPFDAEVRDIDLRGLGKPFILGEFGAKDHPTFKAADPWGMGDDHESFDRRFLYQVHHAFGMGAALVSSWHWRDPMEGVFPCGIVHQTNVPRPTALLYRAMALTFGKLNRASVIPQVYVLLPDSSRQSGKRDDLIRAFHRASDLLVSCRVDFGLLPDSALDRLPVEAKALVYPVPFDPSDEVIERLTTFAEAGGAVYISGDISYDAQRQLTKRDRLRRLCGVEVDGEPTALPFGLPPVAGTLVPAAGSGLVAGEVRPLLRLKLAGAEALGTCGAAPVVTRYRLGKGQVWFNVDPVELVLQEIAPHQRALYQAFLNAAGTPGVAVTPDNPDLRVFRVPGEDADGWVLQNGGAAVEAAVGGFTVELPADGYAFLLVGKDGGLRAVEAQGAVKREGRELVRVAGHAFVVASDDADLTTAREITVMPMTPGEVRIAVAGAGPAQAEMGEVRDGAWRCLAQVAVTQGDGQLVIPVAAECCREMIRVAAPAK
ncbi:MAG: hypothetical protein A3K19_12620 [Lentisphaerae bacterium RIFOXYB12_FULL_65_16]|nr:MAG: hypothetical protein A3K18_24430 [Lentisphaerae bacterium RIFOXYA12_64_32]OGV88067.1 MAG: hypothetical protein A3K19_12620 [Lentisphaerae bacterium RIFOXYB12_FULL_65_16]